MIQNVGQPQKQQLTSVETGVVQVLCAADENYAMSLCVTLRTAAEYLRINHVLKALSLIHISEPTRPY